MSYEPRPDVVWQELQALKDLVMQLLTGAPIGYSSVSEGALRIASNEGLLVEGSAKVEGWLIVTGTERVTGLLEILGTLRAAGVIEFTGPTTIAGVTEITGSLDVTGPATIAGETEITGDTTVTGELDVDGDWSLDGEGEITGDVELTGDLTTRDGGRIVVSGDDGDTTLTNSKMTFANGSQLASYATGGAGLISGGLVMIQGNGVGMLGVDTVPSSVAGMPVNSLGVTPIGRVFRVVDG